MGQPGTMGWARALIRGLLIPGVFVFALAACGDGDSAEEASNTPFPTRTLLPATLTPTTRPMTATPAPTDLPDPEALMTLVPPVVVAESSDRLPAEALAQIDRATVDLAAELEVSPAEIHLVSLESFVWQDASWGCAALRGDESFSHEEIPGYRIILQHGDQIIVYHTDEADGVMQCADREWLAQEGQPIPLDPIAESIVAQAQQDAARRLGLQPGQVIAISVLTVNWPDSSLGCAQPGIEYDTIPTRGYRLLFQAGATRLIYHTSIQEVVPCTAQEEILPGALRQALPAATPEPTPGT